MWVDLADVADIPVLAEMNKRLIEDEHHPNPMTVEELTERMAEFLSSGYTGYVARQAGEIVAYVLYRNDGPCYYMRHLYVERGYRRRGVATYLLDWLFDHAWSDKPVRLDVLAHNAAAIAFYKAYGFDVACLSMEKRNLTGDE